MFLTDIFLFVLGPLFVFSWETCAYTMETSACSFCSLSSRVKKALVLSLNHRILDWLTYFEDFFNTDKIFITNSPFLRNLSSVYLYAISNILRYNWVFRVDNVFSKNIINLLIYMPRLYKVYFNTFNGMFTSKKIYKILCLLRIILLYTPPQKKIVIIKMILCN